MEIQLDHSIDRQEVKKITIFTGNVEYNISINKFGMLLINKEQYGSEPSGIAIHPRVSNEICIE